MAGYGTSEEIQALSEDVSRLYDENQKLRAKLEQQDKIFEVMHDTIHMWKERAEEKDKIIAILQARLDAYKGHYGENF